MISTVLGFNTAIIKQNDNFLALALKIKRGDNICQTYYLQYATLNDLLIILNNQMQRVAHRLIEQGESYREPGLTHQCLYFEQPHTFEQILFIQTAEPALVGHA